jgi:hypothetical protein
MNFTSSIKKLYINAAMHILVDCKNNEASVGESHVPKVGTDHPIGN